MSKNQRRQEPEPDIELEPEPVNDPAPGSAAEDSEQSAIAPDPVSGVAHKRRNDSPEAVALRMHREARLLAARQASAAARPEEIDAKCKAFAEARAALPEETRKLLDRLVAP